MLYASTFHQFCLVTHRLQCVNHALRVAGAAVHGKDFVGVQDVNFPAFNARQIIKFGLNGADATAAFDGRFEFQLCHDNRVYFKRKLLSTTLTELRAMAPPASMGLSKKPL